MFTTAKEALSKAVEVYEGLARLAASVDQLNSRFADFRDEARKRIDSFEARVDSKIGRAEERSDVKIERLEARVRELESKLSSLHGTTNGALAEALKFLFSKQLQTGHKEADGTTNIPVFPIAAKEASGVTGGDGVTTKRR
jgi:molybdopterin converting factor small subunit